MKEKKVSIIGRLLQNIREEEKRCKERRTIAKAISAEVKKLSFAPDIQIQTYSKRIDFNYTSHEQTIEIIKAFGGEWTKEYNENTINYTRKEKIILDYELRIYGGKPPANCKVVEIGEEFVPGYMRKKFKMVCGGGGEGGGEEVATTQQATDNVASQGDSALPPAGEPMSKPFEQSEQSNNDPKA